MRLYNIYLPKSADTPSKSIELNPGFNLFLSPGVEIFDSISLLVDDFLSGFEFDPEWICRNNTIDSISFDGVVFENKFKWSKPHSINGQGILKELSYDVYQRVKDPRRTEMISLPVLALYPLGEAHNHGTMLSKNNNKREAHIQGFPSRFRGYIRPGSAFKHLFYWLEGKYSDLIITGESTHQLECVRSSVLENIPEIVDLKWVFDTNRAQTLYVVFKNGKEMPLLSLDDEYRNLILMFLDLSWRCVTLNPHFGVDASLKTDGVVIIDELDLYLPFGWHEVYSKKLKSTFPNIQFLATSNSPLLANGVEKNELHKF